MTCRRTQTLLIRKLQRTTPLQAHVLCDQRRYHKMSQHHKTNRDAAAALAAGPCFKTAHKKRLLCTPKVGTDPNHTSHKQQADGVLTTSSPGWHLPQHTDAVSATVHVLPAPPSHSHPSNPSPLKPCAAPHLKTNTAAPSDCFKPPATAAAHSTTPPPSTLSHATNTTAHSYQA
jgi:hypothetical protein